MMKVDFRDEVNRLDMLIDGGKLEKNDITHLLQHPLLNNYVACIFLDYFNDEIEATKILNNNRDTYYYYYMFLKYGKKKDLLKAVKRDHLFINVRAFHAILIIENRENKEDYLLDFLSKFPNSNIPKIELSFYYIRTGQYEKAKSLLINIPFSFWHGASYAYLGDICVQLGDTENAIEYYKLLNDSFPLNGRGYTGLAEIYLFHDVNIEKAEDVLIKMARQLRDTSVDDTFKKEYLLFSALLNRAKGDSVQEKMCLDSLVQNYLDGEVVIQYLYYFSNNKLFNNMVQLFNDYSYVLSDDQRLAIEICLAELRNENSTAEFKYKRFIRNNYSFDVLENFRTEFGLR